MATEVSKSVLSHIRLKRAYEEPEADDGVRVLVDRLWPRGVSKEFAGLDAWMKELGPSTYLRTWFGHRSDHWVEFADKYRSELKTPMRGLLLSELRGVTNKEALTLVYAARDTEQNEAVVLRDYLLHENADPNSVWDAAVKVLVTASVVASAHQGGVAPASGVKLFASSVMSGQEFDAALNELLTGGQLYEISGGWKVASRGQQLIRQLETG